MTSPSTHSTVRRFVLPFVCAVLTVVSAVWGEVVLVKYAGTPTWGPLVAAQIATLIAFAMGLLCLVTLLLAVFPGKDSLPDADTINGTDDNLPDPLPDPLGELDENTEGPTDEIIDALKKSAAQEARARARAETERDEAQTERDAALSELEQWRNGTAPELKDLEARLREEANRDALKQIRSLATAADKRADALREARARAEAEVAARDAALATKDEQIAARDEQIAAIPSLVEQARHEGARDEFTRVRIAVNAINDTKIDFHDPLQTEAVARHARRITDAVDRLDPDLTPDHGPSVSLPPLRSSDETSDPHPADSHPHTGGTPKTPKSRKRRRAPLFGKH